MNKSKAPRLVTVAIFTTITIIFWVFMGLYNIITSSPPVNVDPELLKPLDPTLNQEALDRLDGRVFFGEGETSTPVIIREEIIPDQTGEEPEAAIESDEEIEEITE